MQWTGRATGEYWSQKTGGMRGDFVIYAPSVGSIGVPRRHIYALVRVGGVAYLVRVWRSNILNRKRIAVYGWFVEWQNSAIDRGLCNDMY